MSAKATKKNTTIKFADTGKGIPAEKLPELTDMFVRVESGAYVAEKGWCVSSVSLDGRLFVG